MIEINNLTDNKINSFFFKKIAGQVLKEEKKQNLELSIVLVSEDEIKNLNNKYRKKNRPTDVLSFNYNDFAEIVISLDQVRQNARKYKLAFEKELTKVLIHAILHILGYNHESSQKKALEMEEKENYYLNLFYVKK